MTLKQAKKKFTKGSVWIKEGTKQEFIVVEIYEHTFSNGAILEGRYKLKNGFASRHIAEKDWEKLLPVKRSSIFYIELTNDYYALGSKDGIEVDCQFIKADIIKELYKKLTKS
jgi:hypothetical protein